MIRYTVTNKKTGEVLDFKEQKEALDYAQKVNKCRMARITEITYPDIRKDLGEMKYEILSDVYKDGGPTGNWRRVYRIRALRPLAPLPDRPVKAGDLGGWVECRHNLSHKDNCWIYDDAEVLDSAVVSENGVICGNAYADKDSRIEGHAIVKDHASVHWQTVVTDRAVVEGAAYIWDNRIGGNVHIKNGTIDTDLDGDVDIDGIAKVSKIEHAQKTPLGKPITFYSCLMHPYKRYVRFIRFDGRTFEGINVFREYIDDEMLLSPEDSAELDRLLKKHGDVLEF